MRLLSYHNINHVHWYVFSYSVQGVIENEQLENKYINIRNKSIFKINVKFQSTGHPRNGKLHDHSFPRACDPFGLWLGSRILTDRSTCFVLTANQIFQNWK